MTEEYSLSADAWTDLGPTPCFVQLQQVYPARFVIDTAAPATLDAPAHTLTSEGDRSWVDIGLADRRVYARAAPDETVVVVSR